MVSVVVVKAAQMREGFDDRGPGSLGNLVRVEKALDARRLAAGNPVRRRPVSEGQNEAVKGPGRVEDNLGK